MKLSIAADVLLIGGLVAVTYGAGQFSVAAGWIVGGVAAIGIGYLVERWCHVNASADEPELGKPKRRHP